MNPLQQKGTEKERGAALLTVLLLVAVIAILAAHGIDRLAGATKLASNARELSQAKAYLIAAESIGMVRSRNFPCPEELSPPRLPTEAIASISTALSPSRKTGCRRDRKGLRNFRG